MCLFTGDAAEGFRWMCTEDEEEADGVTKGISNFRQRPNRDGNQLHVIVQ